MTLDSINSKIDEVTEELNEFLTALENYECPAADCSLCGFGHCPPEYMQGNIDRLESEIRDLEREKEYFE